MVTGYRFIYIYIYISDGSLIALSLLDIARNWQTEDSMEFVQSSRKSNTTTAEMLERVQAESHVPDYWGWGRREQEPFDSLCECTVWYICMRGVAEHGRFFSGYYISKDKNWTRVLARRWRRCVSMYFFVIYNSENTSFPLRKRSSERSLYIARSSRYFVPCDYSFLTFLPEIYYYIFYIYIYICTLSFVINMIL